MNEEELKMDVQVYAGYIIEQLIQIRDHNRDKLNSWEMDRLADACNLINHNKKYLKEI